MLCHTVELGVTFLGIGGGVSFPCWACGIKLNWSYETVKYSQQCDLDWPTEMQAGHFDVSRRSVWRASSKLVSLNLEGRLSVHSLPQIKCIKCTQCSWKLPNELKTNSLRWEEMYFISPLHSDDLPQLVIPTWFWLEKGKGAILTFLDKEIALVFHKISALSSSGFYTFTVNVRWDGYMRLLNRRMCFRGHSWLENSSF